MTVIIRSLGMFKGKRITLAIILCPGAPKVMMMGIERVVEPQQQQSSSSSSFLGLVIAATARPPTFFFFGGKVHGV